VKVALSGVGGDETFVGYPRYLGVRLSERYARVPAVLRAAARAAVDRIPARETSRDWVDRARRFTRDAALPMPDRYLAWTRMFSEPDLDALVTPDVRARMADGVDRARREAFATGTDPLDGVLRVDLATYLPDDLLVMADRLGMAASLEVRAPFCDHRLVALALSLPSRVKLPGRSLKGLLKAAFADVLPPAVLSHPKQGFAIPLGGWLRGELSGLVHELLAPECVRARGLFRAEAVSALVDEHFAGRRSHADRLWNLMMLELWARAFLDTGRAWSAA
jgi:asparagine synthase (glutamine-hydrolysing)